MRTRLLPAELEAEYDYLRDLTPGAQADVLLCEQRDSGRLVVIKLYRFREHQDQRVLQTSLDRAEQAHIVEVLQRGESNGLPWEVQEYCRFGSLNEIEGLSGYLANPHAFQQFASEILEAVAYLHSIDIVHRDLKPANVLVRHMNPLDLVLADFGLSRQLALSRDIGSIAGTFAYQSPETFTGEYGKPSDWWGAGTILYEAIAGRHFLAREDGRLPDDNLVRHSIASSSYELERVGNDREWRLLRGLLTHDPGRRWGSLEVQHWLSGGTPNVYEEPVITSPEKMPDSEPQPTPAVTLSYRLGSTVVQTPEQLAAAIRGNWDRALKTLAGKPDQSLTTWLEAQSQGSAVLTLLRSGYTPGATLVAMQRILDSSTPPEFLGVPYSRFPERIRLGQDGDQDAQLWLRQLRVQGALQGFVITGTSGAAEAAAHLEEWDAQIRQQMALLSGSEFESVDEQLLANEAALVAAAYGLGRQELEERASKVLEDSNDHGWSFPLVQNAMDPARFGSRFIASIALPIAQAETRTQRMLDEAAQTEATERQEAATRREHRAQRMVVLRQSSWKRGLTAVGWAALAGALLSTEFFQNFDGISSFARYAVPSLIIALVAVAISLAVDAFIDGSDLGVGVTVMVVVTVFALMPVIDALPEVDRMAVQFFPIWLAIAWLLRGCGSFVLRAVLTSRSDGAILTLTQERRQRPQNLRNYHRFATVVGWISILAGFAFLVLSAVAPGFSESPRATVDHMFADFPPYRWLVTVIPTIDPLGLAGNPWLVIVLGVLSALLLGAISDLRRISSRLSWIATSIPIVFGVLVTFAVPWSIAGLLVGGGMIALGVGALLLILALVFGVMAS